MRAYKWGATQRAARLAAALAASLMMASRAPASTYYVRVTGSDAQDGMSPQTAFASLGYAAQALRNPGDRVIVGPGIYNEGNIEPFGSGQRDAPIVFFADASGAMTGDAAGAVLIKPPNTENATTGFLIFGKHDIVIDGFTIDGASDAGIQVRPNFSTSVDSTRITARGNTVRHGSRRGIEMIAAGDVTVTGNTVVANAGSGVSMRSGNSTALRPRVSGNLVEGNGVGVAVERIAGGTIAANTIRANGHGLGIVDSTRVSIDDNQIVGSLERAIVVERFGMFASSDLDFSANVIQFGSAASRLTVTGTTTFRANRFVNDNSNVFDVRLISDAAGTLRFLDNDLTLALIEGEAALELQGNRGHAFIARGGAITATQNRFTQLVELLGSGTLALNGNQIFDLTASGTAAVIADNDFAHDVEIFTNGATVTGNKVDGRFILRGPRGGAPPDTGSAIPTRVEGNSAGRLLQVGDPLTPVSSGVVRNNIVAGVLRVFSRDDLHMEANQTAGIACIVSKPESHVLLLDNAAGGSIGPGIVVVGARGGLIAGNQVNGSFGTGLVVRRARSLTIEDNDMIGNQSGGVSVDIGTSLVGDCNNDRELTIDDILTVVGIVLDERQLRDCIAIDANGDEAATIDELLQAIDGALGLNEPEPEVSGSAVLLRSNRVEGNVRYGIDIVTAGAVTASDNRVLANGGVGIAARLIGAPEHVALVGNLIGSGGGEGILLAGTSVAEVRSNVVFSNGEEGIVLRDARGVAVVNNLVYDNGNDGIAVGVGATRPSPDALLMNNTLHANAGWGVTIGSTGAPSTGTTILNNIVTGNRRGGIAAESASVVGLTIGFNLNNDRYGHGVVPSVTDFQADPRFVAPAGADGVLGHTGFADDNFRLQGDSAAIDAGSATAGELGIVGSAVEGQEGDAGIVDVGHHYGDAPTTEP